MVKEDLVQITLKVPSKTLNIIDELRKENRVPRSSWVLTSINYYLKFLKQKHDKDD